MTITNRVSLKSVEFGVTSIEDVVDAPTIGTATAGNTSATVPFTAAATGGAATTFTAISTPSSITGSSATSPITVTGLTNGTAYTFKVYGANASGTWSAVQSAASNSVTPFIPTFESLATVTVGSGGSSQIDFTSIPSTYSHLQIRCLTRDNRTIGSGIWWSDLYVQMGNGSIDTGNNYSMHRMWGDGGSAGASSSISQNKINWWECLPNTQYIAANIFGIAVIDIFEYANTNKTKTLRGLMGFDSNTNQSRVQYASGLWNSTSAVTNVRITASATFQQYSSFALYGIKAAS